MEIYYTSQVSARAGNVAAWSKAPGFPPLLAVGLSPNAVGIYTEEGRPLDPNKEGLVINVRQTEARCLAWHPLLPLLAVGWKDGAVSFWSYEERKLEEDSKTHRTNITAMAWSAAGDRLVSADDNGKVSIWKTDRLLRPIHVVSYEEQPGCKVRIVTLGPTEAMPETGSASTTVYYGVSVEGRTILKWANDQGYQGLVMDMGEEVTGLIYYAEKEQLVVVGASCSLYLLGKSADEGDGWVSLSKMKFATGTGEAAGSLNVVWAGDHTLASASEKDDVVRMYNFDTEDNYVLQVEPGEGGNVTRICCLAADTRYGLLAAGSTDGRITVFKYSAPTRDQGPMLELARCWDTQPAFNVAARAVSMEWGPNPRLMSVACQGAGVNVCRKTMLQQCFRDGFVVIQAGVDRVLVENLGEGGVTGALPPGKLQLSMQVLGLDVSRGSLLVYDGTKCEVFRVTEQLDMVPAGGFDTTSRALAINNDSIYRAAEGRLEVCNAAGTVKQTLAFEDSLGQGPCLLDCNRDYLAAITPAHAVRVFKVAGREAKPYQGPGTLLPPEMAAQGGGLRVDAIRVNSAGTMVAALCSSKEKARESRLYVLCFENATTLVYDFAQDGREPQFMAWDTVESKVLAVQTVAVQRNSDDVLAADTVATEVALLFVSPDHGVLLQEYQAVDGTGAKAFVGIQAPHLILNKPTLVAGGGASNAQPFTSNVARVLMQGFAGMQDGDDKTKTALLDFSYHLATGNMDEAFRAVKAIKNPAVWENMAHLCIKNKRLDVAEHCLGNMEHARGARAVREAKGIEELDARVATVAVHLDMMDDARKLYLAAERYDLLNRLYQACGQWEKALELAAKNDRIHLKTTHYAYAQYLEKVGDHAGAVEHYEAAGCGAVEVTRMYYQADMADELEAYINKHADSSRALTVWWARYCESRGDMKRALAVYEKAGDALSIVRIYCAMNNLAAAEDMVLRLSDPAAAFHLARQYEARDRISEAIKFYTMAKRYSHGVRLAKKHELDADLVNLALKSSAAVMVDAADYLNEKGEHERAAMLYMKGGRLGKAVEMCFTAQLFDVLQHIADDMTPDNADPALYMRCSEFFMQHGHHDKAVKMLIAAHQYTRALELCVEHDVAITEDMAEAMTPSKDAVSPEERSLVLQRIAKVAKRQGAWQLAAKKYTQAGEKVKAMKALLRSGDTEKIVFFTGVSRQKEIYLMAANYLQTLDWHSDPEIMKNIISFYTKAQAMDSLASFYETCAQIEIDEYRDYEKALQALREALKYLAKSKSEDRDVRDMAVQRRIATTERFVAARAAIVSQPQQALAVCSELLITIGPGAEGELEAGVRVGDIYALMVEYWYEQRNALEAYKLIEQMRGRGIIITPYLDQRTVDDIYKTLGVAPVEDRRNTGAGASQHASGGGYGGGGYSGGGGYTAEEGYVDEDVVDEIDEVLPDAD